MSFFQELKRRNVFRVGVAYLVASWLLLQIADVVLSLLDLPPLAGQIILLVLAFGFIPAIILAWAYVFLRYVHSYVHLTSNVVIRRFTAYVFSTLVLALLWVDVIFELARQ